MVSERYLAVVLGVMGDLDILHITKGFATEFFKALNLLFKIRFYFHAVSNVQLFTSEKNF